MAVVVGFTTVVTQKLHRVVLGNVLGVVLHKFLGALPQSGNGGGVLVQAQHKAVLLSILNHQAEGVVVNVAVELDGGLHAPVVFVVQHQGLAEEEARLEAAHVAVADRVAVDDLALSHVLSHLLGLVLVNPLGEGPVLGSNLAIVCLAGHQGRRHLLKGAVKGLVVEKDPVVVVSSVEAVLDLADRASNIPDVAVSGEGDKGGVDSGAGGNTHQVVPSGVVRGQGKRKVLCIARGSLWRRGLGDILGLLVGAR